MEMDNRVNVAEKVMNDTKERFLQFDQQAMIDLFNLEHDDKTISIWFLGKTYKVDRKTAEVYRENGDLADINEMASIFEYLTYSASTPKQVGEWVSISQLCTNTTDTSLTRYIDYLKPFGDQVELMQEACAKLGGTKEKRGDVSSVMEVFHGVPVWFQYWAADDEFPASVQFLWDSSIVVHFRWSILWNVMTVITQRMKEEVGI